MAVSVTGPTAKLGNPLMPGREKGDQGTGTNLQGSRTVINSAIISQ